MCVEEQKLSACELIIFSLVYVRNNTFKRTDDKLLYMQM